MGSCVAGLVELSTLSYQSNCHTSKYNAVYLVSQYTSSYNVSLYLFFFGVLPGSRGNLSPAVYRFARFLFDVAPLQALFLWIVRLINTSLGKGEETLPFIGVLDIFGERIGSSLGCLFGLCFGEDNR